jgi:hypothetical protein
MRKTSSIRGIFEIVQGCRVSNVAAKMGVVAFFDPLTSMLPESLFPPFISK